jgi:hypothetical protein
MGETVLELTNRCILSCRHFSSGRHGGRDDLLVDILEAILAEAPDQGFDHLSFPGREPTVHRHFRGIVRRTCEATYRFGFNSNGRNVAEVHPLRRKHPVRIGIGPEYHITDRFLSAPPQKTRAERRLPRQRHQVLSAVVLRRRCGAAKRGPQPAGYGFHRGLPPLPSKGRMVSPRKDAARLQW